METHPHWKRSVFLTMRSQKLPLWNRSKDDRWKRLKNYTSFNGKRISVLGALGADGETWRVGRNSFRSLVTPIHTQMNYTELCDQG